MRECDAYERVEGPTPHAASCLLERRIDAAERRRCQQQDVGIGKEYEHDCRAEQAVDGGEAKHAERFEGLGEQSAWSKCAEQRECADIAGNHQRECAQNEGYSTQREVRSDCEHREWDANTHSADGDEDRQHKGTNGGGTNRAGFK